MKQWILFFICAFFIGCTSLTNEEIATEWISKANTAHGTALLDDTTFTFQFRVYNYAYQKKKGRKAYARTRNTEEGMLSDSLINDRYFSRWIDGKQVEVADTLQKKYVESLNSVLYFVQLPKVLNDNAVVANYVGRVTIKGEPYIALKVSFKKEGGGVDFQDEYRYWIHEENNLIDYLAYRFYSGEGGTRFRAVTLRERISGFVVQNYANFKPNEKYPALDDLPKLFEAQRLQKVSEIKNEAFEIQKP